MTEVCVQGKDDAGKFQAIFKDAPIGIYTINTQGIIDTFNPEMVRLSGAASDKEVVGLDALTLPSYKEVGLTDYFRKGLEGTPFYLPVVKYKSFTGSKVSYRSYRGIPLYNDKGQVDGLLCLVLDISEKIEIEEARQHAMKLATIIDQSPDAILVVRPDAERTIEYWNTGAEKIFGYSAKEAIGQSLKEFIMPPEERAQADQFLLQLKTEPLVHAEVLRTHKDGHVIPVEMYMFPIKHETGTVIQLAAILRDISQRKQAEAQMIERDSNLKKMNDFMVGRELKMIELKEQIKGLKNELESRGG